MLIAGPELVSDMCRYTRLDGTGTHRNTRKTREQEWFHPYPEVFGRDVHHCEQAVTHTVEQAEIEDGTVFTKEDVGDECAEHREEVGAHGEEMVVGHRFIAAHIGILAIGTQEVGGHEDDQDALHAIETEAFGEFVPDDKGDASGELGLGRVRGGKVLFFAHVS